MITAGESVVLQRGDSFVEETDGTGIVQNRSAVPAAVYFATLPPTDAPVTEPIPGLVTA